MLLNDPTIGSFNSILAVSIRPLVIKYCLRNS